MSFEDSDRNREARVDVFSVRTFSYGNHVGYNTIISKVTLKRILKRLRLSRKRINNIYIVDVVLFCQKNWKTRISSMDTAGECIRNTSTQVLICYAVEQRS